MEADDITAYDLQSHVKSEYYTVVPPMSETIYLKLTLVHSLTNHKVQREVIHV